MSLKDSAYAGLANKKATQGGGKQGSDEYKQIGPRIRKDQYLALVRAKAEGRIATIDDEIVRLLDEAGYYE